MVAPNWTLDATERVHATREGVSALFASPAWVLASHLVPLTHFDDGRWLPEVVLLRGIDAQLLALRGRYAYTMPGVEIQ